MSPKQAMEMALDCLLYYNRREAYPRPESPTSKAIEALRAALAEAPKPYAYLVVQTSGFIVGAWRDRETAEAIAAKQLARDAETVVPVVLAEAVKAERAAAVVSDQIRRAVPIEQTGIGKLAP